MIKIALVRPGATSFDEQGRIKGCLDIPLSECGKRQAHEVAQQLSHMLSSGEVSSPARKLETVYTSPCQSAQATAEILSEACGSKVKTIDCMRNVNHGLWQGKLIEEVKRLQPSVYRHIQDNPLCFSPPGGETIEEAQSRVKSSLAKIVRKHKEAVIALVVPDPLASLVRQLLIAGNLGDLWKAEQDHGSLEMITLEADRLAMV